MKKALLFSAFILLLASNNGFAKTSAEIFSEIPVQHNGRVKPFESFAKEALLSVTGKTHFEKKSPVEIVLEWMTQPEKWVSKPMIPLTGPELQQEFGLSVIQHRVSPEIILGNSDFMEKTKEAQMRRSKKETLTQAERNRIDAYSKALAFQEIANGTTPGFIAHPEDPRVGWLPLQEFSDPKASEKLELSPHRETVDHLVKSYAQWLAAFKASGNTEKESADLKAALQALFDARNIVLDDKLLKAEINYNHIKPFAWASKFYAIAFLLFASVLLFSQKVERDSARHPLALIGLGFFAAGFVFHVLGFYYRCIIAGRPPVTNMYESVIWVSWAVVFFSSILFFVYRSVFIPMVSTLVASLALLLAQSFPALLDPSITPLVPVLRNNYWLTIHVLTITLSYGAFMLAWGIGHVTVISFLRGKENAAYQEKFSQFLYRTLQIGVILLATGTVLGGVWANYSWGRFWGWDPKETWALIALLGYISVLHGRFAGWLGPFGTAVGSVVAFLLVVMAWYGVNFVLAAGLHSYGFGGGGSHYVLAVASVDLIFIGAAAWIYRQKKNKQEDHFYAARKNI